MLVLDVFNNWIPASIVVDLVSVTWGINNIESQLYTILLDDVRNGLNFGGRANGLIWGESSFGIDQV